MRKEYERATSAIKALNICLGEDYMIDINDSIYNAKQEILSIYECNHCTTDQTIIINKGDEDEKEKVIQEATQIPIRDVRRYEVKLNEAKAFFLNTKYEECWTCPNCQKENDLRTTVKITPQRQQTDFLRVVPMPPIRRMGIANRNGYDYRYNEWFNNFMEEITHAMVLYRIEWKNQNDGEEMGGFIDHGDKD